jgi:hypothetical protein
MGDLPRLEIRVWPSTAEEKRRHRAYERRRHQYGRHDDLTPNSRAYAIMTDVVQPGALGFELMKPRYWARRHDEEHVHLLWFQPMKGTTINIAWGTSAAYVPTRVLPRPSWPRTLKQSRAAIWQQSTQVWPFPQLPVPGGAVYTNLGPQCVHDDAQRAWSAVHNAAARFWERAASPAGMLAAAREQLAQPRTYELHNVHNARVAAFALARLGDLGAARHQLAAAEKDPQVMLAAEQALSRVAARAAP